jgi:hypothetical protein
MESTQSTQAGIEHHGIHRQAVLGRQFKAGRALGGLKVNYILCSFIPMLIFAPLFSYYMAVTHKEAKGYPHTTITNMSRFYPQDIVFRFFMLPAGGFINLIYFLIFKWVKKVKEETQYPGGTEQWLLPLGQLSVIGFEMAIGTIDGGKLPNIHIYGALVFFLMLLIISTTMSFVL